MSKKEINKFISVTANGHTVLDIAGYSKTEEFRELLEETSKVFNKPPRAPERISRILQKVEKVWVENSDMRLGQLIVNALGMSLHSPEIFYAEDSAFEEALDEWLDAE